MKQENISFLKRENRKAHERYRQQVQKDNELKVQALKEEEKLFEQLMKKSGATPQKEDLELKLKEDFVWKDEQKKNIKNLEVKEKKVRGRGRPKKNKEEKLNTKAFHFRLSGDYLKFYEGLEGKDSGAKCRELIEQYAALKTMVIGQVNQLKSSIYSARKIFNQMEMTRTVYQYKTSGSLEMSSKEKEFNEKLKHFVNVAQTLIKIGNFKGPFLKKELDVDELEFLNWILFEVR